MIIIVLKIRMLKLSNDKIGRVMDRIQQVMLSNSLLILLFKTISLVNIRQYKLLYEPEKRGQAHLNGLRPLIYYSSIM